MTAIDTSESGFRERMHQTHSVMVPEGEGKPTSLWVRNPPKAIQYRKNVSMIITVINIT